MTIDVDISARHVEPEKLQGKTVVVIDVLRATSVMCTALNQGAKQIIPALTTNDVFNKAEKYPNALKAGERHAMKVEGFDAGNSPFEFMGKDLAGKSIIMSTTNGTNALLKTNEANDVIIGSFINLSAITDYLSECKTDVVLVCAGTDGNFSMDDALCAGAVINKLTKIKTAGLTDVALAHSALYKTMTDLHAALHHCKHYNILREKGLKKDLEYCLSIDLMKDVPKWNGEIVCL